jgi:hypothetical protein
MSSRMVLGPNLSRSWAVAVVPDQADIGTFEIRLPRERVAVPKLPPRAIPGVADEVIEQAGDDPPIEQPEAFLKALRAALGHAPAGRVINP